MNNTRNILISDFSKEDHTGYSLFTCASFEDRSLHIIKALDIRKIEWINIFSTKASERAISHCDAMEKLCRDKCKVYSLENGGPLSYAKAFYDAINETITAQRKKIYIDISTFTHEMLLVLLSVIRKKEKDFDSIVFLYLGAQDYSIGDSDEHKWLSKGCKEIRNVLGYPGFLVPKKPVCLIVLVGYEHERATALINEMDPDKLLIGYGKIDSEFMLSDHHISPMRYFEGVHKNIFASRPNVERFDFSVKDIDSTVKTIKEQIGKNSEYDYIIVPLNTKTSTLAVGLLALENPAIQVCYAEPETYNVENYSISGDQIVEYRLK